MSLFELDYDISMRISDEVFRLRKKHLFKQFKKEWRRRRPYKRLVDSGGRKVHEGRAFLCLDDKLKTLRLIRFQSKYYIGGIKLKPWINYDCKSWSYGIHKGYGINIPIKRYHMRTPVDQDESWSEHQLISRNLMNKEEDLIKV